MKVPTLRQALELTQELDWLVNVELKSFPNLDRRRIRAVLETIHDTSSADRVLLSSFDHDDLGDPSVRGSGVMTGVLVSTPLFQPERYVREFVGADCYHPSAEVLGSESRTYRREMRPENLRTEVVRALQEKGVPVLVYTVNDSSPNGLATHLAEAGVTGLFSDDPGGLHELFGKPWAWGDKHS